ncbi:MAG: hypothetical protein J7J06_11165, partial [Methanosarcinales archaeon]|nr:hypothetical protein [Methanosarcinales archaeon]
GEVGGAALWAVDVSRRGLGGLVQARDHECGSVAHPITKRVNIEYTQCTDDDWAYEDRPSASG